MGEGDSPISNRVEEKERRGCRSESEREREANAFSVGKMHSSRLVGGKTEVRNAEFVSAAALVFVCWLSMCPGKTNAEFAVLPIFNHQSDRLLVVRVGSGKSISRSIE